jgi:hypothetical protein
MTKEEKIAHAKNEVVKMRKQVEMATIKSAQLDVMIKAFENLIKTMEQE